VLTLGAAVWAARAAEGLDRLVSIVDIGALFAFGMLHLSVMGYYGLRRGAPGHRVSVLGDWVVPLVGLAIIVAVIVTANREAHWVGLVWLALALLALLVLRRRDAATADSGGPER
jgi:hypothetical protein